MRDLTHDEAEVGEILGEAWNRFALLPVVHPSDRAEFVHHLHALQNIVLSRPAMDELRRRQAERGYWRQVLPVEEEARGG